MKTGMREIITAITFGTKRRGQRKEEERNNDNGTRDKCK